MSNTIRNAAIFLRLKASDPRRQKARELVWAMMAGRAFVLVLKEAK